MQRIVSVIQEHGFQCLPCHRLNLDAERFSEYRDTEEHHVEQLFERPDPATHRVRVPEISSTSPAILRYFLDGSRRTYRVADIIIGGRYLPLVAAQVGVAVMERTSGGRAVLPVRKYCQFRNIVAFPDTANADDLRSLQDRINRKSPVSFQVERYEVKRDHDPIDLAVAKIMRRMQDMEVEAVAMLSQDSRLGNSAMLIVDGPLRFREMPGRHFDIVQFRNVLGVSNTVQPSQSPERGRRKMDVGLLASSLEFGDRTPVFKTTDDKRTIGMWYLRLRRPEGRTNALQGVVKIECYAVDWQDREEGLDGERVSVISGHILRERNVTPFGADWRWASHLYPIYLAERYIKSSFMSDECFLALF